MECDDDQGIDDDSDKTFDSNHAIVKEARAVYNQLKLLHFTLKGSHDSDSGLSFIFLSQFTISMTNFIIFYNTNFLNFSFTDRLTFRSLLRII